MTNFCATFLFIFIIFLRCFHGEKVVYYHSYIRQCKEIFMLFVSSSRVGSFETIFYVCLTEEFPC